MTESKKRRPLNPDRIVDPRSLPKAKPRGRGDLPHLFKEGCTYFVIFCLADAVPDRLKRRRKIENIDGASAIAKHFDVEPSAGSRMLQQSAIAAVVEESLLHFQGDRYALSAWCVMPNHVHVVVTPYGDHSLSDVLHSWKSFSAHHINMVLGRKGRVWQEESFDHMVRHERAFAEFVAYTENNPVVAGLCARPEDWPFSSARFRVEA
jgi:REP element-mobilizing transposase RayT